MSIKNFIYNSVKVIISSIFFAIVLYLTILASISTTFIADNENPYFIKDSVLLNIFFVLFFIALLIMMIRSKEFKAFIIKINNDAIFYKKCKRVLLAIYAIVLFVFVLVLQKNARGDQLDIFDVASEWTENDFASLEQGGYLDFYPNQIGIVLVLYFLSNVFGLYNFTMFQIVNIIAIVLIITAFTNLSDFLGCSKAASLFVLVFSMTFLPLAMYVTFVYGTLLGLCLSIYASVNIYKCHEKWSWLSFFLSIICSILAITIKSNYLIFLLGNIILVALLSLKRFNLKSFLLFPVLVMILLFNSKCVNGIVRLSTGVEVGDGMSYLSWIAMGLMENENANGNNGWWNNYNGESYVKNNYNKEKQADECKEYIISRLQYFSENKQEAIRFFSDKNASQWNIPDFQANWINRVMPSNIQYPQWIEYIFSEDGAFRLNRILNYWQFVILCGAVLSVFLMEKDNVSLAFMVIFIGGFIFHTFWEAKGQYTLPYFVTILPVSARGIIGLIKKLERLIKQNA